MESTENATATRDCLREQPVGEAYWLWSASHPAIHARLDRRPDKMLASMNERPDTKRQIQRCVWHPPEHPRPPEVDWEGFGQSTDRWVHKECHAVCANGTYGIIGQILTHLV